ncbi:MAG: PilZ domain-containing protein [Desulfobacterales bacterium]|nr:PilZ domain-containing protein [Desulfobacterales bacterium]
MVDRDIYERLSASSERLIELLKELPDNQDQNIEAGRFHRLRKNPRRPCIFIVDYEVDGKLYDNYILDLSLGGVFIESEEPFGPGRKIRIKFFYPDGRGFFWVKGTIEWRSSQGIGVHFNKMEPDMKNKLARIITCVSKMLE